MKIVIEVKNIEMSDAISDFVEKKFDSVKKFLGYLDKKENFTKTLSEIFIEVERETKHHKKGDIFHTRAQINLPGKILMVKTTADDLYASIMKAKDLLKFEIEQYKLKKIDSGRRGGRMAKKIIKEETDF